MKTKVTGRGLLVTGSVLALLFTLCLEPVPARAGGVVGTGTPGSCTEGVLEAVLTGGGLVTFNCGYAPHVIPLTRQIVISLDTVIDGGDLVALSGGDSTRLFEVNSPATLTLRNLGLADGNSGSQDGGAILNNGTLVVEGSTLSGNVTGPAYCGGAIASSDRLTISASTLTGNRAGDGGAVCLRAGPGTAAIRDSVFEENSAINPSGGWGGALLIADSGSASIEGSSFERNYAGTGGAVFCSPRSTLTVVGGSVQDNRAAFGGGIGGTLAELAFTDLAVSDNWATMDGGGVLSKEGSLAVSMTTFAGNSAGNNGAGIYHYRGTLSVVEATLTGNRARVAGGGIHAWEGQTTLERVTLNDNHAGYIGGGLHAFYGVVSLSNVTLSENTASSKGGGLGNWGGRTELLNVTFGGNLAAKGGALSHSAGGWSASTLRLKNTALSHGATGGNCFLEPGSTTQIVSEGYNLSSDVTCQPYFSRADDQNDRDPKLGPLADNGGNTMTLLPEEGSPALNRGQCTAGVGVDQRGVTRPQSFACDIGAVEVRADYVWRTYVPLVMQ